MKTAEEFAREVIPDAVIFAEEVEHVEDLRNRATKLFHQAQREAREECLNFVDKIGTIGLHSKKEPYFYDVSDAKEAIRNLNKEGVK